MNSNDFGSAKTPPNGKVSDTHTHGDCEKSKDSSGVSMSQAGPQGKSATDNSSAFTDESPDIRFRRAYTPLGKVLNVPASARDAVLGEGQPAKSSPTPVEKDNCQTQASSSYAHGGWPHPSRSTWPSQDKATGGIGSVLGACTLVVKRIFVMYRSRFAVLLIVLLAAVFAYTVWPTPWRYEHANIRSETKLVKMHRITGVTEVLDARGWYRLRSREQ